MTKIKVPEKKFCPVCHQDSLLYEDLASSTINFKCGSVYVFDKSLRKYTQEIEPCPNLEKIDLITKSLFKIKTAKDWQCTFPCVSILSPDGWGKENISKQWEEDLITLSQYYRKIIQSNCSVEKNNWIVLYERLLWK